MIEWFSVINRDMYLFYSIIEFTYPYFLRFTKEMKTIYETKFDKEYQTQYFAEVNFLTSKGIRYSFVKKINGLITYKYEKSKELFEALLEFYS